MLCMAVTRISGLASGMDIDAMVKQLMKAESQPLDKMNQNRQLMEWKREGYRETSVKLVTFAQAQINDTFSKMSALNAQTALMSGNTSAVTAKALSTASGVMDIEVTNLATAASIQSSTAPTKSGTSASETDWGKVLLSNITGANLPANGIVTVNGAEIKVDPGTETLASFVQKINTSTQAGVTAIYDPATGKMSVTSKVTGSAGNNIQLKGDIFTALGLGSQLAGGSDAKIKVNGLEMSPSSNNFTLNGVEITLNAASNGQKTHIEVTKDVDKIVETVQSFVNSYNELLSFMNGKVDEERYSKYPPLTSDQKKGMSDSEISLWENKAKSGMLKRDSILKGTVSQMRAAVIQNVKLNTPVKLNDGTTVSEINMTELGITTGTYETRGKLFLDTDKLRKALAKNPEIANGFFGENYSSSHQNNEYTISDGMLARLRKISNQSLNNLAQKAGTSKVSADLKSSFSGDSTMGESLRLLDVRISDFQAKLTTKETNYYKKFAAMEAAINKYNSVSNSLSSFK